eukprot:CAMPEP_0197850398 /NCGR_PEP_ID=MMETSP1438-20131217/15293_1 /TAXON_ID=1461541 /ORGANISM="Pterosperma sp., Strain CCMP1384" /LENGTH=337 /DNA_ID=CAMNT_0043463551 /DNA_START=123 /DNA_END=1136 /DNA_ORIENTATION=-
MNATLAMGCEGVEEEVKERGRVWVAFLMVIGAGLATTVGSTFAFCSNLADTRILAASLGLSAGVMLYVSFAEIFTVKSVEGFADSGYDDDAAVRLATFCFFSGLVLTFLLDRLVHHLVSFSGGSAPHCGHSHGPALPSPAASSGACEETSTEGVQVQMQTPGEQAIVEEGKVGKDTKFGMEEDAGKLQQMGLLTGLAIGLHNFPEGLATFVAALADEKLGGAIAIAIALHNVPEGVCVAMPVYYATKSKWKGFWWSFISGVSEPIGGLIGYAILDGDDMSARAYGVLFGIVGGMMTYISLKELIPTALRYDPDDRYVSNFVILGMAIMAASLLLMAV